MKTFTSIVKPKVKKEPKTDNIHIVQTRSNNPRKVKRKVQEPTINKPKKKKPAVITAISNSYEGEINGIMSVINTLPENLQILFKNSKLKTVINGADNHMYVLENKLTIRVQKVRRGGKPKLKINIKEGKKHILNTYI